MLRELKSWARYFFQLSAPQKAVLFYSEGSNYWPFLEGAVEELLERKQALVYVSSDPDDPIFQKASEHLTPLYFRKLLPYFLLLLDSKVVVMTLTELHRHHLKRSVKEHVKYVYIYHAMVSTHMMYKEGSFDHYDSILCTGPYQLQEIQKREKAESLAPKRLVECGYYRLERIHRNLQDSKAKPDHPSVLIAPSWGETNILNSGAESLIQSLLDGGYRVILRPHPEHWKHDLERVEGLNTSFQPNELFSLERSTATEDSLLQADVLISDWSGIVLEFAFGTERPVLFMNLPRKVKNPNYEQLELEPFEVRVRDQVGIICDSPGKASELIDQLVERQDEFRQSIRELRDKSVFNFGSSSAVAADEILSHL